MDSYNLTKADKMEDSIEETNYDRKNKQQGRQKYCKKSNKKIKDEER